MSELKDKYIRFDWAIKRLLRQKANFSNVCCGKRLISGCWKVF